MYGSKHSHYVGLEDQKKGRILKRGLRPRFESAMRNFRLDENSVILDTETTGKTQTDQLIEICILDSEGNVLLDERVKSTVKVSKGAMNVHGIKDRHLKHCRTWPEVYKEYVELTAGKNIIAYNVAFDRRIIKQTCKAYGLTMKRRKWHCLMLAFSELVGRTRYGDYKWHKLSTAAWVFDVPPNDGAHTAIGDCKTTLAVAEAFLNFDPQSSLPLNDEESAVASTSDEVEIGEGALGFVLLIMLALMFMVGMP